jgi:predicted RNA-binding protein associated with RNAse of E/G family
VSLLDQKKKIQRNMASTINQMIDIHLRAGFTRGSIHNKFGFKVFVTDDGDQLLIINVKQGLVIVYTYDARGNFKDYESVEIGEQTWARAPRKGEYYSDVTEIRLDR